MMLICNQERGSKFQLKLSYENMNRVKWNTKKGPWWSLLSTILLKIKSVADFFASAFAADVFLNQVSLYRVAHKNVPNFLWQ